MTYEENVRAILECNFIGAKDDIIDIACKNICELQSNVFVGDEIISKDGNIVVITAIVGQDGDWCCIDGNGCVSVLTHDIIKGFQWHKTGRHFPELVEVLKHIKESLETPQ